ncbi:hypothetical protein DAPK24_010710 [Pichia kluyveri]|uniref:Zn(2)-C6 fungal-type domain-containing protein n=1 Tax=Pichia kluyveri TaxID=36015 RepID=A0AAV5QZR3_PICKL|nr:hypothetical protein DAPK24_010710 [Pichia kluyveri]
MVEVNNGTKPKTRNTKSRNGCVTCKKRRLKCDESKPYCNNCIKRGIVCGGYAINFKWKDFSDQSNSITTTTTATSTSSNKTVNIQNQINNTSNIIILNNKNSTGQKINQISDTSSKLNNTPSNTTDNIKNSNTFKENAQTFDEIKRLQNETKSKQNFLKKALEEATLSVTGRSTEEVAIANLLISQGKNPDLASAIVSTLSNLNTNEEILELLNSKSQNVPKNTNDNTTNTTNTTNKQPDSSNKKQHNNQIDSNITSNIQTNNNQTNSNQTNNIQPNKLKINQNIKNEPINSPLHSLADIAIASPNNNSIPPSPFTEMFLSGFSNKPTKSERKSSNIEVSSKSNTLPNDSPLNLFKESSNFSYIQQLHAKSPNYSMLNQNYDILNPDTNNNINIHQTGQTPKIEELDSNFPYAKLSPLVNENLSSNFDSNTMFYKSSLPFSPFSPAMGFSQNNFGNNDLSMSNFLNQASPMDPNTPRGISLNIPQSPFRSLVEFANNKQKLNKNELEEGAGQENNANEEEQELDKDDKKLAIDDQYSNNKRTDFDSAVSSPRSITSDISSTLDIIEHKNSSQTILPQQPINIYSLHLPDEHLSTLIAFDQHTCGIMSIKNGPTENPWRTFLLPMSQDHPVVRSALLAMTCFHVARGDSSLRDRGVKYMKDAIVSLVHGLSGNVNNPIRRQDNLLTTNTNNNKIVELSPSNSPSKEMTKKIPPDVALATCIALAMGEAWDRHISTGIAHLKGAKSMIVRVLHKLEGKKKHKRKRKRTDSTNSMSSINSFLSDIPSDNQLNPIVEDKTEDLKKKKLPKELAFLVNAWMYFDVLARMTSECEEGELNDDNDDTGCERNSDIENDEVIDEDQNYSVQSSIINGGGSLDFNFNREINSVPLKRKAHSFSGTNSNKRKAKPKKPKNETNSAAVIAKYRSFDLEDGDVIDPLLGVAQTLFPIMGEVATLIAQIRHYKTVNSLSSKTQVKTPLRLISKAVDLKSAIEHWKLPSLSKLKHQNQTEDPSFDLNAAVATAEAYRHSTLLYLHQIVPEIPSPTSHSLAENVMMLLASIPSTSRTVVTHMFPLFVASCEALPGEERDWAKDRWTELIDKMWIGTLERAWEVVKEVWARKDAFHGKNRDVDGNIDTLNQEHHPSNDYKKVKRRMSIVLNGEDDEILDDESNVFGSWTHWTTVMKEWGWEILLA